jgi:phage-related protein
VLLVAGIVAAIAAIFIFRNQIGAFFQSIGQLIMALLQTVGQLLAPLGQLFMDGFGQLLTIASNVLSGLGAVFTFAFQAVYAIWYQLLVQPWVNLWNVVLREPVTAAASWLAGIWGNITQTFSSLVVQPLQKAWTGFTTLIPKAMQTAAAAARGAWVGLVNVVRSVINNVLRAIGNSVNSVVRIVNRLIATFNRLPGDLMTFAEVPDFLDHRMGETVTARTA